MRTRAQKSHLTLVILILHRRKRTIRYCTPQGNKCTVLVFVILGGGFRPQRQQWYDTSVNNIASCSLCLEFISRRMATFLWVSATIMTRLANINIIKMFWFIAICRNAGKCLIKMWIILAFTSVVIICYKVKPSFYWGRQFYKRKDNTPVTFALHQPIIKACASVTFPGRVTSGSAAQSMTGSVSDMAERGKRVSKRDALMWRCDRSEAPRTSPLYDSTGNADFYWLQESRSKLG